MGPEHRITLGRMMDRLEKDTALEAATKVNTLENVRITFDHKVEREGLSGCESWDQPGSFTKRTIL